MSSLKFTSIIPVKPDKARLIERLRERLRFPYYEAMVDLLPSNPRDIAVYGHAHGSLVRGLALKAKCQLVVGGLINVGLTRIRREYLSRSPLNEGPVIFVEMSDKQMPLRDGSVDAYVLLNGLVNPRSHENSISEAARILRNDGKLILSLPNVEVYPNGANGGIASLGYTEFTTMLWKHFGSVRLFVHGQVRGFSKVISDVRKLLLKLGMLDFARKLVPYRFYAWLSEAFHGDSKVVPIRGIKGEPIYLLAVCEKPIR
ncbi:MAG: methyltransferase domain-containing protein [Candidatus Micrarchaeota archaeon]|nr:methyltransferase domain-containing protein [Candidatus Micrarchaeota archaeon]